MLFIHPNVFGKGIGKALVNYALQEFHVTRVDVNEDNQQSVGFYEQVGFKTVSRTEVDTLGKPYPILQMELIR